VGEIDKYYQILGLNMGASEEEIKQAYRDLANVWHPDRFPHSQRLRKKANEKIREINIAYEKLTAYAKPFDMPATTSRMSSSENGINEQSKPSYEGSQRGFSQPSFTRGSAERISWKPLSLLFVVLGLGIGINFTGKLIGAILGFLIGMRAVKFVNRIDQSRRYKTKVAWGVVIAGLLIFAILLGLTEPEHYRSTSAVLSRLIGYSPSSFNSDFAKIQEIGFLFENIRQANLQKDIDLYMSCFSRNFSDKEGKREDTLKIWERFDYQDLSYELKKFAIIGDIADVKLQWVIVASEKPDGKLHNGTTLLDVSLKKEYTGWKITGIKPVADSSKQVLPGD
jgi:hypothetical protein